MAYEQYTGRRKGYNDRERSLWVENDESLYHWRLSTHMSLGRFVELHRREIDDYIVGQLGEDLRRGSL